MEFHEAQTPVSRSNTEKPPISADAPTGSALQEFLAGVEATYGFQLQGVGENAGDFFDQEKAVFLELLDKQISDPIDRVHLIRDFFLKMVSKGLVSPLETSIGQTLLAQKTEEKFQSAKKSWQSLDQLRRARLVTKGLNAAQIESYLQQPQFQFDEQKARSDAATSAKQDIEKHSLSGALEAIKLTAQKNAEKSFTDFINQHEPQSVDIAPTETITPQNQAEIQKRLQADFADGNFLFHSTNVAKAIQILQSGSLMSSAALKEQGVALNGATNNSGFEGISWNFNQIDAMPGDRYHLVGFVSNLNEVFSNNYQLSVPSRAAPYEVIQLSPNLDAQRFYRLKNQHELYGNFSFGEKNSVMSNLVYLTLQAQQSEQTVSGSLVLDKLKTNPDFFMREAELDQFYRIDGKKIILSDELLQQTEIPVLLVFLRALLQTDRLQELARFRDVHSLREAVEQLKDSASMQDFRQVFNREIKQPTTDLEDCSDDIAPVVQNVAQMYFVAPDHDAEKWRAVLQRCQVQPKGMLVYNGEQVQLENFASRHSGDHNQMTQILRSVIPAQPAEKGGIDYGETFLGKPMAETARTGYRQQVLRESDTAGRQVMTREDWLAHTSSHATSTEKVVPDPSGN